MLKTQKYTKTRSNTNSQNCLKCLCVAKADFVNSNFALLFAKPRNIETYNMVETNKSQTVEERLSMLETVIFKGKIKG